MERKHPPLGAGSWLGLGSHLLPGRVGARTRLGFPGHASGRRFAPPGTGTRGHKRRMRLGVAQVGAPTNACGQWDPGVEGGHVGLVLMGVEREPCLVLFGWLCGVSLPPRCEQLVRLPPHPPALAQSGLSRWGHTRPPPSGCALGPWARTLSCLCGSLLFCGLVQGRQPRGGHFGS